MKTWDDDALPVSDGTTLPAWLEAYCTRLDHVAKSHQDIRDLSAHLSGQAADDGWFAAEGIGLCGQVGERLEKVHALRLFLVPELLTSEAALSLARRLAAHAQEIRIVSRKTMASIGRMDACQGMMLQARLAKALPEAVLHRQDAVVAVLDGLETPGNIGTIFRTCDGAGVDAVLYCNRRARKNHPELIKASMGAVLDIPFLEVTDVAACAAWLSENRFETVLADPHGVVLEEGVRPPFAGKRLAIVVGNERYGIHPDWSGHEAHRVAIPMRGRCDSLNAGVAASLLLYKFCGFRRTEEPR